MITSDRTCYSPHVEPDVRGRGLLEGLSEWERRIVLTAINETRDQANYRWPDEHGFGRVDRAGEIVGRAVIKTLVRLRADLELDRVPKLTWKGTTTDKPLSLKEIDERDECAANLCPYEQQEVRGSGPGHQA